MTAPNSIRIVIADDSAFFRDGVRALLDVDPELEVVGEAPDGAQAVALVERLRPDVALLDMRMPVLDGVEATRRIRVHVPTCRVVALTTFDEDDLLFAALRAGACGYLLKDLSAERLLDAVRRASRGESVLAPRVVGKLVEEFSRLPGREPPTSVRISPREREVLLLLARGASNKEIAASLHISLGTVKNHLTALYEKLGVTQRVQAAIRARELGLM